MFLFTLISCITCSGYIFTPKVNRVIASFHSWLKLVLLEARYEAIAEIIRLKYLQ